jgi:hypothetical protein
MVSGQQNETTGAIGADKVGAIMPFNYGTTYMNTVNSCVDINGIERIFASGSDGYVYELDVGTSFDGNNIPAHILTSFNCNKYPRNRKHYHRAVFQASCGNTATVNIGYDLSYASIDTKAGLRTSQTLIGNGSYWEAFIWNQFTWDTPYITDYVIDTPGDGTNINLLAYGDSAVDDPYTILSAICSYSIGRLER